MSDPHEDIDPLEALDMLGKKVKQVKGAQANKLSTLIQDVHDATTSYVVFAHPYQAVAVTFWTVNTWVALRQPFRYTPYLNVTSPDKSAGKSTLFDVLEQLVHMPLSVVDPSPAALYSSVDALHPTLFIDEFDAHRSPQALRGVLNAGFQKGKKITRKVGKFPVYYDVYCPKAIGGIGHIPDTLAHRSIPIQLQRAKPSELAQIKRFRVDDAEPTMAALRDRMRDWADEVDIESAKRPKLPADLGARAQDIWEPLFVIADLAGGKWPHLTRTVAVELHKHGDGQPSEAVRLIEDVREAFDGTNDLFTEDLIVKLRSISSEWNRLNAKRLGNMLADFDIRPSNRRIAGVQRKGYYKGQFIEVWERYLA